MGGFTRRQSFNAGVALVANGEFTIVLAQLAARNPAISEGDSQQLVAFAGRYVLATATIGVFLMKESNRLARTFFRPHRLDEGS